MDRAMLKSRAAVAELVSKEGNERAWGAECMTKQLIVMMMKAMVR